VLANAGPSPTPPRSRKKVVAASVREVAQWLGDTPSVAALLADDGDTRA
jgi:hypothetical protein